MQAMLPMLRRLATTTIIIAKMRQGTPPSRKQKMKLMPRLGTIIMPSKAKQEMRKMPKMLRIWVVLKTQAIPKMRTMLKKMRPTPRLETTITTLRKTLKMLREMRETPNKMKQPTPQALRMRRPREMRRVPPPQGAMAAG